MPTGYTRQTSRKSKSDDMICKLWLIPSALVVHPRPCQGGKIASFATPLISPVHVPPAHVDFCLFFCFSRAAFSIDWRWNKPLAFGFPRKVWRLVGGWWRLIPSRSERHAAEARAAVEQTDWLSSINTHESWDGGGNGRYYHSVFMIYSGWCERNQRNNN